LPATAPERDDPPALYDPEKLRTWRAESGLTREQVCTRAGLSYPWLRKLERGEADPSLKLLVTLARFYGHDPAELIGGAQ
jgi:transcriptional regulator with XRE-family HTH domain